MPRCLHVQATTDEQDFLVSFVVNAASLQVF